MSKKKSGNLSILFRKCTNYNQLNIIQDTKFHAIQQTLLQFQTQHQQLLICPWIDFLYSKFETIYLVSVEYKTTLYDEIVYCRNQTKRVSNERIYKVTLQLLNSFYLLHYHLKLFGLYFTSQSFCLDNSGQVKMTLSVLIPSLLKQYPKANQYKVPFLAPEIYSLLQHVSMDELFLLSTWECFGAACDVWSLAVILLEYIFNGKLTCFSTEQQQQQQDSYVQIHDMVQYCLHRMNDTINEDESSSYSSIWDRFSKFDSKFVALLLQCLSLEPEERPSIDDLLCSDFFVEFIEKNHHTSNDIFSIKKGFQFVEIPTLQFGNQTKKKTEPIESSKQLIDCKLCHIAYKEWKSFYTKQHKSVIPLLESFQRNSLSTVFYRLPCIMVPHESVFLNESCETMDICLPFTILQDWCQQHAINLNSLLQDTNTVIGHITEEAAKIETRQLDIYGCLASAVGDLMGSKKRQTSGIKSSFFKLVTKKELDMTYQTNLVKQFRSLLIDYPHTRMEIIKLAKENEIPYILRGEIWAAILSVEEDYQAQQLYDSILEQTVTTSCDRQISVDVPRCHQYNLQLATIKGKEKLTRVLRSWVKYHANQNLVYWQGLDSLSAPFVVLNFHCEARAFCCLKSMVNQFVRHFFASDNSVAMERCLNSFGKLLLYHDPELGKHLRSIGFTPELFAIPWFLTLYAHVLPIEKIYRLWDSLLLGNDINFPLYIGISFMKQMRYDLMHADFQTAIFLLTNMHGLDIHQAIDDASFIKERTPKSMVNFMEEENDLWKTMTTSFYRDSCILARISAQDFEQSLMSISVVLDVRDQREYNQLHIPIADHVGIVNELLDQLVEEEMLQQEEVKQMSITPQTPVSATSSIKNLFAAAASNLKGLASQRSYSQPNLSQFNTSSNEKKAIRENYLSIEYKKMEERILNLVSYKNGLPIVIISSQKQQEELNDSSSNQCLLRRVEQFLLEQNVPYCSVVQGGIEALQQNTKIAFV